MTDADEFLAHFGVKGMKWGVTHKVGSNGRVTNQTSHRVPIPHTPFEFDTSPLTKAEKRELIGLGATAIALGVASVGLMHLSNVQSRPSKIDFDWGHYNRSRSAGEVAAKKVFGNLPKWAQDTGFHKNVFKL